MQDIKLSFTCKQQPEAPDKVIFMCHQKNKKRVIVTVMNNKKEIELVNSLQKS